MYLIILFLHKSILWLQAQQLNNTNSRYNEWKVKLVNTSRWRRQHCVGISFFFFLSFVLSLTDFLY